jgi:hypothetical protein
MSSSTALDALIEEIERRERLARRRALVYTAVPILVAIAMVVWTSYEVNRARNRVQDAEHQLAVLQRQADWANQQLKEAADNFVSIATATKEIESLVESKQSYLRTIDEARFLIDIRMRFDVINRDLLQLSATFPAVRYLSDHRKWVTVVKSSSDLNSLRAAARSWIAEYGTSEVAIYRSSNGYYALAILGDGTFTDAYRLTISLIRSGRSADAYFAGANQWGPNLLTQQ